MRAVLEPPRTAALATAAAAGADAYEWALDPLQTFDGLLKIAHGLALARPASADAETGDPLTNLYLAICALDQILADHLHSGFLDLTRLGLRGQARRALKAASTAHDSARERVHDSIAGHLVEVEREILALARNLAAGLLRGETRVGPEAAAAVERVLRDRFPAAVRSARLKLPQSFRGVELYPEDCSLLGRRAAQAAPPGPILVIGLRTSGLYMAPLCAAALDLAGRPSVSLATLRPGSPLLARERDALRAAAAAGATAFVVDDPTWRGNAFAKVHSLLAASGFAADRILLAACEIANQPVFRLERDDPTLTPGERAAIWQGFAAAPKVVLGKDEWEVERRLEPGRVEQALNRPAALRSLRADGVRVLRVHPFSEVGEPPPDLVGGHGIPDEPRQRRFHVRRVFEVEVCRRGTLSVELIAARGVGLGFFGYHSLLVLRRLAGWVPEPLALEAGILFVRWEAGEPPAQLSPEEIEAAGRYVAERARATALPEQPWRPESRLLYSGARQAARVLSRTMGRPGALAQFRIANVLSRDVAAPRRSVVDARMGAREWLRTPFGQLLKLDAEEHGVDITDLCTWDPAHDLASAMVGLRLDRADSRRLLDAYVGASGDTDLRARVAAQLLQVAPSAIEAVAEHGYSPSTAEGRLRHAAGLVAGEEALSGAVNDFLAAVYLPGAAGVGDGELWAIDLDDTLEGDRLGAMTTSPAGALALRMLQAHGHTVIASSGRSLHEVQDRCAAYRLPGGIAEYGAVAWDAVHGRCLPLAGEDARRSLERLRQALTAETDILVDPRYRHTLRLFRNTPDGRRGMPAPEIEKLVERHGIPGLEVVEGFRKTVVWPSGTEKAAALPALLESLGIDRARVRMHAVGDEFTDFGLMREADRAHAPGNATAAVRERAAAMRIEIASRERQAGVLQIVERALHGRRGCAICTPPPMSPADRALVAVLSVQDLPKWRRFAYALHPAALTAFERQGT